MSTTDPFQDKIAAAERREAEEAAAKAARAAEEKKTREAARAQAEAERKIRRLRDFGHGFLRAVANKVVSSKWGPGYILLIKQYSEALLRKQPSDLPKINPRHAEMILDKFEYGLSMYDGDIPDGTFYGQQLIAERQEAKQAEAGAPRLKILQGKPSTDIVNLDEARERLFAGTSQASEPKAATTPPKKKTPARYKKAKAAASA